MWIFSLINKEVLLDKETAIETGMRDRDRRQE